MTHEMARESARITTSASLALRVGYRGIERACRNAWSVSGNPSRPSVVWIGRKIGRRAVTPRMESSLATRVAAFGQEMTNR